MPWLTCCNFSQALLCCGKDRGTQMSVSLWRRLGVSQQLWPLGCSFTSLTLCLRLPRGVSSSCLSLFSLPHLHKPMEELHPSILMLPNVTINSTSVYAKPSYLHRSFQLNFCANPILTQPILHSVHTEVDSTVSVGHSATTTMLSLLKMAQCSLSFPVKVMIDLYLPYL